MNNDTTDDTAAGDRAMHDLADWITAQAAQPVTLACLSARAGLSPCHLQRRFTAALGVSPKAFHAAARLAAFKQRLRGGADVLDATFGAGYGSTSRIYEQVGRGLGMTPRAYRSGGLGETIVHATRRTAFGPVLMAASDRGVCAVLFGDDATAQLAAEFPRATLIAAADAKLDDWLDALDDHLSRGGPHPRLPLDLRGTAFQIAVWRFLLHVRPGETVSYALVAAGIGSARAARAVGSACGANRIAVLVPCHRALRGDGAAGGYRWGVQRKAALLAGEAAAG